MGLFESFRDGNDLNLRLDNISDAVLLVCRCTWAEGNITTGEIFSFIIHVIISRFFQGQGHFVTSHLGNNMASVTWATKVSTKWVDQIDQLIDIFEEVSIFVVWLGRFAPFAK